jgi:transcriptional regulator with XRE-family HTH domain
MTDFRPTEGQIEQLLKARWHAIGLSQADLAEVLDAAFQRMPPTGNGTTANDGDRRSQIAEALDIPLELLLSEVEAAEPEGAGLQAAPGSVLLQSFLGLRLLRAFHELRDHRTRRMLVHLAEQIVKRQEGPTDQAG